MVVSYYLFYTQIEPFCVGTISFSQVYLSVGKLVWRVNFILIMLPFLWFFRLDCEFIYAIFICSTPIYYAIFKLWLYNTVI